MCLQQFQLLPAQQLEAHLASWLENKLASQLMNEGLASRWTAAVMPSADRPVFLGYGEKAIIPFLALVPSRRTA